MSIYISLSLYKEHRCYTMWYWKPKFSSEILRSGIALEKQLISGAALEKQLIIFNIIVTILDQRVYDQL